MSGVLVLAEHRQGELRDVTLEMISAGNELATSTGQELSVVLFGARCGQLAQRLASHAGRVIRADHPGFAEFNYEVYQRALVKLVAERQPSALLVAHSAFGSDLAPSLAVELGVGSVSDACSFRRADGGLLVVRGMYGGKLSAERLVRATPAILMVRQSNFRPQEASASGVVEEWDPGDLETGLKTRFVAIEEVPTTGIDITKADVVVAIGRGVREEKNIGPVRQFAESIGAVLAGSRPVIDAGWLPKETQVGSSGKTVKPKVYIALGISGAFQHVAGMRGAETIIAVNRDPHAPIFTVADFGIVDDMHAILPALQTKLGDSAS